MKLSSLLLSVGALLIAAVSAQDLTQLLGDLPQCALPCVLPGLMKYNCSLATFGPCFCGSIPFQLSLSTCVQQNCTFDNQVRAADVGNELCAGTPKPSRSAEIQRDTIILAAVTYPIVALRCYQRWSIAHQTWWDDIAALVATIFLAALDGMGIASASRGFGQHYWDVPSANGALLFKLFWIIQIFYVVVQIFAKLSICLLYIRIFPRPLFQTFTKLTMAFIALHGTGFIVALLFQCTPINSIWNRNVTGKCINLEAIGFAGAAGSIFEDLVILVLPISELKGLSLGAKRRLSLVFMFSIGSFACVTSMVRLKYLSSFGRSFDLTWNNVDIVLWSIIELHAALICVCLPSLRPLLVKYVPSVFKSVSTSKNNSRTASHKMLPLPRSGRHNESYRGLPEASDSTANIVEPEGRRTAGAGWDFRKDSEKGEVRFQVVVEGGKGDENIGVASSK